MDRRTFLSSAAAWLSLPVLVHGDASPAEIERLIRQLGSRKFREREQASRALEKMGEPALAALQKAADRDLDIEVRHRSERLVRHIEGVEPSPEADWDYIGRFTLRDRGKPRTIKLYYYDSDSAAEKDRKQGGLGIGTYPNVFLLHAMYKDNYGKWTQKEVYDILRVRFTRVKVAKSDFVELEFRRTFRTFPDQGETLEDAVKRLKKGNKPFTMTLFFVEGVPTLKDKP
jgi:hypothetical protein